MALMTPQQTVRFFILGLPIGLILTGILAMFIYFRVDDVREERERRVPVSRPLNEADLRASVTTFSSGIGPRHPGAPETLESAAKYVQSTLGPANLGFKVSRHEFDSGGRTWYNLIIDVPGAPGPTQKEIVLVTANYDSLPQSPGANLNASGMAAMMGLAQSFAGSNPARTLRFAAFVLEAEPVTGGLSGGAAAYISSLRVRQDQVVAVVALEGLGRYSSEPGSQSPSASPLMLFPEEGNFLAAAASPAMAERLPQIRAEFSKGTPLPLLAGESTVVPGLLGSGTAKTFADAGFPVVRFTDTGELRKGPASWQKDSVESLDFDRFLQAARGIESVLRLLLRPDSVPG